MSSERERAKIMNDFGFCCNKCRNLGGTRFEQQLVHEMEKREGNAEENRLTNQPGEGSDVTSKHEASLSEKPSTQIVP